MADSWHVHFTVCSSSRADGPQGALSPGGAGGRDGGAPVPGVREAQAHHPLVQAGGGDGRPGSGHYA